MPVNDSEIDGAIIAVAQVRWRKVAMIIAKAADELGTKLPDGLDGRLVAQGEVGKWRNSEVRLP